MARQQNLGYLSSGCVAGTAPGTSGLRRRRAEDPLGDRHSDRYGHARPNRPSTVSATGAQSATGHVAVASEWAFPRRTSAAGISATGACA